MSDESPVRTSGAPPAARRWLVFAAAALILGGSLFVVTQQPHEPAERRAGVAPPVIPAAAPEPAVVTAVDEVKEEAEPVEAASAPAPQALTDAPGFDIVRVAPDGGAVVAGHAAPGAMVTVYADAIPLAEVEADAQGNFVAIFRAEPAAVPQALTLGAVQAGGEEQVSEDVVVLLPEAPEPVAAAAEAEAAPQAPAVADVVEAAVPAPLEAVAPAAGPGEGPAEVELSAATSQAPVEAAALQDTTAPAQETGEIGPRPRVAATAVLRADGVEVVDGPAAAVSPRQVSLASISYGADGDVVLAGLGTAGARLRAYVDDGFAEEGEVGGDGRWTLGLDGVDVGLYRLRIDQIDIAGQVASRVETPFQRDVPRAPMPRPGEVAGERPMQVTVQPGTNLWTLARVHYGAGVLYTQIFTANQHLIRDPHLIYPGQIFDLPEVEADR